VLLVIPAYIFHRKDIKSVVLIGEGLAVAAVLSAPCSSWSSTWAGRIVCSI
jgi:hypothetical protein